MANSFPGSGLAYADAFSVGTANAAASSLYVCSSCVQATRIEHTFSQDNLHHNTLWLRAMNSGAKAAASIGFTVVNNGGDHHRANIEATANAGQLGGNLALYTRNNSGPDVLGLYINHTGNVGINTTSPSQKLHVEGTSFFGDTTNFVQGKISWNSTRFVITSCGTANIAFATDDFTDRMTIQCGTGNVGIATSTPNSCTRVQINVAGSGCYGLMINKTDANESTIRFKSTHGCGSDYRIGASIHVDSAFEVAQQENSCSRFVIRCTGNVGIGIYTPNAPLHVQGPSADGTAVFRITSTSAPSSFNYAGTLINGCLCSNRNYIFMIGQDLSNRNSGYIGYNHTGTTNSNNNFLTFGHFQSDNLLNLLGNGNVGVGTTSPTYKLQVNGTFYAAGSSCEYKTQICNYNTDSCMFMKLKPVTYQYKDEYCHLGKELKSGTQIGLIAEDTAEVFPELAILKEEENEKVVRNVDYEKLSIVLLAEVQKLRQEVDQLKNK
jgi:hypothetical protein